MVYTREQFKLLALLLMLIDHIGFVLLNNNLLCRGVGRLAFPMFVYLLVDGFFKTRELSKYARRMLVLWVLSIIPYSLAFYGQLIVAPQNVFASLYLYLGLFCVLNQKGSAYIKCTIAILTACLAESLQMEYGWYGVLIAVAMFYLKDTLNEEAFTNLFLASFANMIVKGAGMSGKVQLIASLSAFFIPVKGQFAESSRPNKSFSMLFYLFYPLHLTFLGMCQLAIR